MWFGNCTDGIKLGQAIKTSKAKLPTAYNLILSPTCPVTVTGLMCPKKCVMNKDNFWFSQFGWIINLLELATVSRAGDEMMACGKVLCQRVKLSFASHVQSELNTFENKMFDNHSAPIYLLHLLSIRCLFSKGQSNLGTRQHIEAPSKIQNIAQHPYIYFVLIS